MTTVAGLAGGAIDVRPCPGEGDWRNRIARLGKSHMDPLIPIDRFEIFATGLDHPECCAFDRNGDLWAGGEGGQVYRISPKGDVEQVATLGSFNGGVAFSPGGDL